MGAKLIAFFKKETILCVAALLAVISMAWIPPDGEYMGYINWQVLVLLFCLMSVMGGLQALGIFKAIANTLLHWANGLRQLTLLLVMLCFFFAMVVMAVMIPVIMAVLPESVKMVVAEFYTGPDSYMGTLLVMLPVMVSLFAAILCGTPIGHEFKDRTAYMNFSLPVSRVSFYLGKYLSGFVLCVGVFMLAYAMALLTTSWEFDAVTGDMVIRSVVCTVVSLFAFTATAFCIGSFSKGPTTMAPFFLMTVVLPLLLVLVSLRYGIEELLLLPVFLPDTALVSLGSSVMGSVNGFFSILGVSFIDIADLGTMLVIGVVWGLAFLILGMFRIMRREM